MANLIFALALLFFAVGTWGLLKLPDVYTRLHATAIGDTIGIGLAMVGFLIIAPSAMIRMKLLLIAVLFWIINPTISHFIGKVALLHGTRPCDAHSLVRRQGHGARSSRLH